jgi:8-oxo-dGTP pyrophosphatase MutT (NUDIX family)
MLDHLIQALSRALGQPLPGEDAQYLMAPSGRTRVNPAAPDIDYRNSSVLILLYPHNDSISTVLIKRHDYQGAHSGQIGFPGGKHEKTDGSFEATALRESQEELGIDPNSVTLVGSLTNVYIPVSRFKVHPYVGVAAVRPVFTPDPFEVKDVLEIDLRKLTDKTAVGETVITTNGGFKIKTPYYNVEGFIVWGATAMIISELNAVIDRAGLISS